MKVELVVDVDDDDEPSKAAPVARGGRRWWPRIVFGLTAAAISLESLDDAVVKTETS